MGFGGTFAYIPTVDSLANTWMNSPRLFWMLHRFHTLLHQMGSKLMLTSVLMDKVSKFSSYSMIPA